MNTQENTCQLDGLGNFLGALNQWAYSRFRHEQRVIEKYENRYTIINFRLRPWLPSNRVECAYNHLQMDIEAARDDWRAVAL